MIAVTSAAYGICNSKKEFGNKLIPFWYFYMGKSLGKEMKKMQVLKYNFL